MPVPRTRLRWRGLNRARLKLCKRTLNKILTDSSPPNPRTVFQVGDVAAAVIVLNAIDAALAATDPR